MYLDARFDPASRRPRPPSRVAENAPEYDADRPDRPDRPDRSSPLPPAVADRVREARALRVAAGLVRGASDASADRSAAAARLRELGRVAGGAGPPPTDEAGLVRRLRQLVRTGDRMLAEQLRLLPGFEISERWRRDGCRDCAAWLDRELGVSRVVALERLRVARSLAELPVLESLFAVGTLSWSKVRELTRVADADCEAELAAAAIELSASETAELCRRWRHRSDDPDAAAGAGRSADDAEAAASMRAFEERFLAWREVAPGKVRIVLELPTDAAAEYLRALEQAEDELREDDRERDRADAPAAPVANEVRDAPTDDRARRRSARQYRADAAVLMSAKALAHAGEAVSTADRYRVLLNVDARALADGAGAAPFAPDEVPPERPTIPGFGPVSIATARRIAQSAGLTVVATLPDGEIAGVGASTRAWPARMERAIRARDRHCQVPGCTATRWTHVHHVVPVADGGPTSVANGSLVCGGCHRRLHEGGLRLERVAAETPALGPDADAIGLDAGASARARGYVVRVQRFRLLRADGRVVAGPGRRGGGDGNGSGSRSGSGSSAGSAPDAPFPRGNGASVDAARNGGLGAEAGVGTAARSPRGSAARYPDSSSSRCSR